MDLPRSCSTLGLLALVAACAKPAQQAPADAPAARPSAGVSASATAPPDRAELWTPVLRSATEPLVPELSAFGTLETPVRNEGDEARCRVRFRFKNDETKQLFDAPGLCFGEWPGMNTVGASSRIGKLTFPVRSSMGAEYHLLIVALAGGGNAVRGVAYWIVALRGHDAWAAALEDNEAWQNVSHGTFVDSATGGSLLLWEAPAPAHPGIHHAISYGKVKTSYVFEDTRNR